MGIILLGILAFVVYTQYMNGTLSDKTPKRNDEALSALTNRFIAGEIDEGTYQRMKQILQS